MNVFKKQKQYKELDTITFGMVTDAINSVNIVDDKMQQFENDNPAVTAALVLIPGYALGHFLIMFIDSYMQHELGDVSNASQDTFMQTADEKFTRAILNYLVYEKHTSQEDAASNTKSILGLAHNLYSRVATEAYEKNEDIIVCMKRIAPNILLDDVINNFAGVERGSPEATAISNIATSLTEILSRRYKNVWLFNLQKNL